MKLKPCFSSAHKALSTIRLASPGQLIQAPTGESRSPWPRSDSPGVGFAELLRYVPCGHNATKRACSAIQSLRGEPIESLVKAGGLPREALLADYGICRISGHNRPTNWLGTRRSIDPGSGDSMPIAEDHIGFASVSKVSRRFGCIRAHVVKLFEHGI